MNFSCNLGGKIAVVTGGSQGIGFALAKGLAKCSAQVVIVNRRVENGEQAAKLIRDDGGAATAIPTDVSKRSSVEAMVQKVLDRFGRIDILVNDAGVNVRKPATEVTEEDLNTMIDLNLKGLFFCCQAVAKHMIKQGGGKIINISSMVSTYAMMNRAPYCATKAGVSQLTRTLALEWAKFGINVNAIGPGIVRTPLTEVYMKSDPQRYEKVLGKVPLGRVSTPEDLIGVTVFLASDASDYMTGQTIIVDGGYTLGCLDW